MPGQLGRHRSEIARLGYHIGFDMALLRAHLDHKFPRFVYHDGVFESLDPRKKK
ncbi:MAG: DUF2326 domain-containing protein, partial [Xanthobacteraceae bacterium]